MGLIIGLENVIDGHVHFRTLADTRLPRCAKYTAQFVSATVPMPNTNPHIFTSDDARRYFADIDKILRYPGNGLENTELLMTLYLTPQTDIDDLIRGYRNGDFFSVKQYPHGATTNSESGVTGIEEMFPLYAVMEEYGIPLHMHCEMPAGVDVDVFDSEAMAIEHMLLPILKRFPKLKAAMEHITTKEAAQLVAGGEYPNLGASVTPQHLLFNRNHMLRGKLDPHLFCMPILKRKEHMLAIRQVVASGHPKFWLGTDSAPHLKHDKLECGCAGTYSAPVFLEAYTMAFRDMDALQHMQAFASNNFCKFFNYEIPERAHKRVFIEEVEPWVVPEDYEGIVPLFHGQELTLKARLSSL